MCGAIVCLRLQYSNDVEKVADTMHINDEQALKLQELERGEVIALLPRMKAAIPIKVQI